MNEKILLAIYFILVYIASLCDYKECEIPDSIHIGVVLVAIFFRQIHLLGLLIGVFFLLITLKYDCIGGGDIKFLLATGLLFGFWKTYLLFLNASILQSIFGVILFIKCKKEKKKFEVKGLPLMPFWFLSNFFLLFNIKE